MCDLLRCAFAMGAQKLFTGYAERFNKQRAHRFPTIQPGKIIIILYFSDVPISYTLLIAQRKIRFNNNCACHLFVIVCN